MPNLADLALCIRVWDWSETSQTVSLFCRSHGLLRGIAKGAKRQNAAFSGGIELLTAGNVAAIVKPGAELATLTEWDLTELFPALSRGLPAFHAGMYVADLIRHYVHDSDPHPALFDATLGALRAMDPREPGPALLGFQWAVLAEAGYKPELRADIVTRRPLEPAASYAYLPRSGGFTGSGPNGEAPSWGVRADTLELLRELEGGGTGGARTAPASGPTLTRANHFLAAALREVLGTELPTLRPVFPALRAGNTRASR